MRRRYMLNFWSNGPSGAELFAIFYISIFSYLVKRTWSNPWLNPAGDETKVNQGCSKLRCSHFGNKIKSVRPFCQKSVFFRTAFPHFTHLCSGSLTSTSSGASTKGVGTLRLSKLIQKVHFYHNMVQIIFQDLRWTLNNFFKSLKFGHFLFDHNLSLDSPIRTPTGIIIDHNKAKVHANFWIKQTFGSKVIHSILNFVKKGVVKNSNPVRRWHQPPIPSHPPPWELHLWILISPPLA